MRITSKLYIVLGLGYGAAIAVLVNGYFSEKQNATWTFLFIGIELILGAFLWATFNFVDIFYYVQDSRLECFFHGKLLRISSSRRVRKLPVTARWGMIRYAVGYIVFKDESEKRKVKFFIVREEYLPMIRELSME
jgi:hypothetical protein